jgi:hypothetical protein
MHKVAAMNIRVSLRIRNGLKAHRTLILEPWAEEYDLTPGRVLEVVAEGDPEHALEVEIKEDSVVVYTFDSKDSTMTVLEDGQEVPPN